MGEDVTRSLRPGDVLLFHGEGAIPWAIRRFDESDVDHAGLVLDPETLLESTASGIRHASIQRRIDEQAFTYVRRLAGPVDASGATDAARAFERAGEDAIHVPVVLLATLGMMRKLPIAEPTLRRLLVASLARAADIVDVLVRDGRGLLLSSDLVYRAYRGADDPALALEILFPGEKPSIDAHVGGRVTSGEAVLMDWASSRSEPGPRDAPTSVGSTPLEEIVARYQREIAEVISAFRSSDAPVDASADADARSDASVITDDELHRAAIRFRDAVIRSSGMSDPSGEGSIAHPWGLYRAVSSPVTPGDLRYSPSLRTVTSLRPAVRRVPHRAFGA